MTDEVSRLFELMERWRHLPGYRLEMNLAPIFGLHLPRIFIASECLKVNIDPTVIPEFPLLKDRENREKPILSEKADYFALGERNSTAYLIELKTDLTSYKSEQLCHYLKIAEKLSVCCLVKDVRHIAVNGAGNSQRKKKYGHLLHLLKNLNLITTPDSLYKKYNTCEPKQKPWWSCVLKEDNFEPCASSGSMKIEVVYIVPNKCKFMDLIGKKPMPPYFKCIDFHEIANIFREDDLEFATFLSKMATKEAGDPCPKKVCEEEEKVHK